MCVASMCAHALGGGRTSLLSPFVLCFAGFYDEVLLHSLLVEVDVCFTQAWLLVLGLGSSSTPRGHSKVAERLLEVCVGGHFCGASNRVRGRVHAERPKPFGLQVNHGRRFCGLGSNLEQQLFLWDGGLGLFGRCWLLLELLRVAEGFCLCDLAAAVLLVEIEVECIV